MQNKKPIAIIGVGNKLMADEGVGIHAFEYLEGFEWPEDIELIDAAVPGTTLMYMLEERDLSIIIDCADFGGKPGEVMTVETERLVKEDENVISLHGTSLTGTLGLAETLGIEIKKTFLIAVQPKDLEIRDTLSKEAIDALPKIKDAIDKILNEQG